MIGVVSPAPLRAGLGPFVGVSVSWFPRAVSSPSESEVTPSITFIHSFDANFFLLALK